ncbi:MAG TPA: CDP-alcohol phosphatidyltransferase family protein, partial [Gammaproteobacteria bacterium]|nr:CDP-alcohol phosphatidyltransferase family protein [Gammaproteobacteria bacterium]
LARARGETSAFGARLDMETDALLILVLASLAWAYGKAGAWILLAGLLRYLFVAASYALPWLARALPASRRRQAVCVLQIGTLIACVSPLFPPPASGAVALVGLVVLAWSFGVDVAWLARRRASDAPSDDFVEHERLAREWLLLALAVFVLNAALTFHNHWPTPWIEVRHDLSIELAVLLGALVAYSAFVRSVPRWVFGALAAAFVVLALGRYAAVTAPALYGRPVNLYWDAEHLPKIAAMLAAVAPAWLVAGFVVAAVALLAALAAVFHWALTRVARGLGAASMRRALGALALALIGVYSVGRALDLKVWRSFTVPVTSVYLDQVRFLYEARAADARHDLPLTPLAPSDLGAVAGADVLLMFLESYGATSYERPEIASVVEPQRAALASAAGATGRRVVSAFVTSPTFGGGSWLAHSSLMSQVEVRDAGKYELLLTQKRDTLPSLFAASGWRSIAWMPGMRNPWPEGSYYGFAALYGEKDIGYRGPEFGWWRIPDQFALEKLDAQELAGKNRAPRFVFFPTINTHVPFRPTPPYQGDRKRLLSDEPFDATDVSASVGQSPDWTNLAPAYAATLAYTFEYLAGYVRDRADADFVLVLVGDHQPAASVTGVGARWDVPVHVVTNRQYVADALVAAGFVEGVGLEPDAPAIANMPGLAAMLLRAFDSSARPHSYGSGKDGVL